MRRYLFLMPLTVASLLSNSQTMFASGPKDASCAISFASNVVVPDGRLLRDLNASQFIAQAKHTPVKVTEATQESGPRRILLVLETGRHVPERVRVAEYNIVADVLSEARPEDAFGLLTARGPVKEVRFGQPRDAILAAVKELETGTDSKEQGNGVLDTLMTGAQWFDEPKPGDAILLMSLGFESPHRASFGQVRKALTDRQVRIFSLMLGTRMIGTYTGPTISFFSERPQVLLDPSYSPNMEDETSLAWGSGGYSAQVDIVGSGQQEQQLTDKRLEALKTAASRMQSAITEYYRLTLNSSPAQITLGLAPEVKNKIPNAVVLYPRQLPPCSGSGNP